MLKRLPEQLVVLRRSLPLAISQAQAIEVTANEVFNGMTGWRALTTNSKDWKLENDRIVLLNTSVASTAGVEYGQNWRGTSED
jgi:hypothetical protein